jgi:hypothetical protein
MPTSVDSHDAAGYLGQTAGKYAAAAEQEIDEDGFFTCAVSVQHKVKKLELEIIQGDPGKSLWPSLQPTVNH